MEHRDLSLTSLHHPVSLGSPESVRGLKRQLHHGLQEDCWESFRITMEGPWTAVRMDRQLGTGNMGVGKEQKGSSKII